MPFLPPCVIAVLGFGVAAAFPLNSLSGIATTLIDTSSTNTAVAASKDVFRPACLGRSYGYELSPDSCADALLLINSSSTAVRTYGMRGTGDFDVTLPRRYISREYLIYYMMVSASPSLNASCRGWEMHDRRPT